MRWCIIDSPVWGNIDVLAARNLDDLVEQKSIAESALYKLEPSLGKKKMCAPSHNERHSSTHLLPWRTLIHGDRWGRTVRCRVPKVDRKDAAVGGNTGAREI